MDSSSGGEMTVKPFSFFILALLATALIASLARHSTEVSTLQTIQPSLHCTQPPTFQVGYKQEENGVSAQGQGFHLAGLSWLTADICTSGTLTISGHGEPAAGKDPTLTINLNSTALAASDFPRQEKTISIKVPRSGRLTLGYFNDYYKAEVRIAFLEQFQFNSATCHTFKMDVSVATGGSWRPEFNDVTLTANVPMTLTPCAAGTLTLQAMGNKGQSAFPTLRFEQGGQTVLTLNTTQNRQRVQLKLSDSPLTITLTNPYNQTVADRNLNITGLRFTPDSPKSP